MLRGDRIYAYEAGVLRRRYEGIVHKVQMLNVKLGFDMSQYVKDLNLHGIKTITFPEPCYHNNLGGKLRTNRKISCEQNSTVVETTACAQD